MVLEFSKVSARRRPKQMVKNGHYRGQNGKYINFISNMHHMIRVAKYHFKV